MCTAMRGGRVVTGGALDRGWGVQACPEPRLASVEHLLGLCEEHIAEEHAAASEAAGRPGEPMQPRLLAELSQQLKGGAHPQATCQAPPRVTPVVSLRRWPPLM